MNRNPSLLHPTPNIASISVEDLDLMPSVPTLAAPSACPGYTPDVSRFGAVLLALTLGAAASLHAQQLTSASLDSDSATNAATLPAAPGPETSDQSSDQANTQNSASDDHVDGQSKRIFGIIPNFRAVNANVHLPPQTVKDKFVTASQDSFDYSSIFIPMAVAAYDYGRNSTPEFGSGGVAYGRYLWHSVVDQTSENYFVEFIVPVITHEDTRYYSLQRGGFLKRTGYSLSRAVITRTDSGGRSFNYSEVVGAGAAAGVSNLYYPTRERSLSNTADQWGTDVGIDALSFFVKEFSPDISHFLFHGSKKFHAPGGGGMQ
jgi:hypothetical protein